MRTRQTKLYQTDGLSTVLSHYAPGVVMPDHTHDRHQVSWLLVGHLSEDHRSSEKQIEQPSIGVKPAGLEHANDYGRHGALILSVNIDPAARRYRDAFSFNDWRWTPCAGGDLQSGTTEVLSRLIAARGDEAESAIWDLLALSASGEGWTMRDVPHWLMQVRDQLSECTDELDLAAMANEAGVHRVHLSRAFTRSFGIPPSVYRARCRVARSIASALQGESLAVAAQNGGFADQAHFSRLVKRQTSLPPRRLVELMAVG
jgi:AraC family transcriptional regulator